MEPSPSTNRLVLVTGGTGYVGGRLCRRLERLGWKLRLLARRPERLKARAGSSIEAVAGDLLEASTLGPAFEGVDSVYYLVHSMGSSGDFEERDRSAARNFAIAARQAKVRRVIYLGALG